MAHEDVRDATAKNAQVPQVSLNTGSGGGPAVAGEPTIPSRARGRTTSSSRLCRSAPVRARSARRSPCLLLAA